ncbi:cobalt ABC transporter permease [Intrasporangium chromatireducens Q5-1]|uniref:Cobalt ABC transporter permease n=1 Tax=Intrasporangium chromatireducens Q5-1 TaxID=584657 RepID=W9GEA6_9MICO|nr:PDGLE domain-containing protein [Intrasporangium chromatireducens]EWT04516.1 cobalt ABC transporter permease [Intrasporangium chromatireducens Q5-1]
MTTKRFAIVGVLLALLVAGVLSFYASKSPDGLQHVAETKGFSQTETQHSTANGPLAGYEAKGVSSPHLSKGLAGVVGVGVTGLVMGGLVLVLRRQASSPADPPHHDDDR